MNVFSPEKTQVDPVTEERRREVLDKLEQAMKQDQQEKQNPKKNKNYYPESEVLPNENAYYLEELELAHIDGAHQLVLALIRWFAANGDEKGMLTAISLGQHLYHLESHHLTPAKPKRKKAPSSPQP